MARLEQICDYVEHHYRGEISLQEIMEQHGFYNQKLFCRMFKERYDCTPRGLRGLAVDNPYV